MAADINNKIQPEIIQFEFILENITKFLMRTRFVSKLTG